MNCAENEPQEIDERYQEGQKQQVAVPPQRLGHENFHPTPQQQVLGDGSGCIVTTRTVNIVENRDNPTSQQKHTNLQGDVDLPGITSDEANHAAATDASSAYYLTADGIGGEIHLPGAISSRELEEAGSLRRKTLTMRDPQESQHVGPATPLGEVESGDDSDCVAVASAERKVEPLKINLARDREPLRTIIKLTPGSGGSVVDHHSTSSQPLSPTIREVPGSPKITIKPPKPPPLAEAPEGGGSSSSVSGSGQHSNSILSAAPAATTTIGAMSSNSSSSSSIPKLTIKALNPVEELLLPTEASAEQMQIIPKLLIKGSSSDGNAQGWEGATEPHIVPKLTIRGVNNHNHHLHHHHHHNHQNYQHHSSFVQQESQPHHSATTGATTAPYVNDGAGFGANVPGREAGSNPPIVPKLTIKMDNNHPHHHHHIQPQAQQQNSLRVKDVADAGGNRVGSPIPKLHLKAILSEGGGSSASSSSSQPAQSGVATNATMGGSGGAVGGSPPVLTSSEGVKLTIKPLPEPPKLPKLTIKTTGLGTIAETSDASQVSSTSCSFSPNLTTPLTVGVGGSSAVELHQHQHQQMQSLVAAQQQPASPSDQHSNISSSSIPKLTIKPFSPKGMAPQSPSAGASGGSSSSSHSAASTAGMMEHPQIVPKLTIKPIPPPPSLKPATGEDSNSSSETSINSFESSPVSSSSASLLAPSIVMTTSPSALRMTIKVPPPQQDHNSLYVESGSSGHTAVGPASLTSPSGSTGVTKLNIKPILPPPVAAAGDKKDSMQFAGGVDNKVASSGGGSMTTVVPGDGDSTPPSEGELDPSATIVIPKVTIKTLANPRGQETEILSTPKVTLRPIPKPSVQDGSPTGGAQQLLLSAPPASGGSPISVNTNSSTGHFANSSNSPSAEGSANLDSPRIILKINKGSSSTTTTSMDQQQQQQQMEGVVHEGIPLLPAVGSSILANELKRPMTTSVSGNSAAAFASSSTSSSSSMSGPSSTTVSVSATSSSVGSDPASPSSSGGGGDQGDPGSPEAKKSKLEPSTQQQLSLPKSGAHIEHNAVLRQQLLQNHHQNQLQFQHQKAATLLSKMPQQQVGSTPRKTAPVSDVIVIDDDSKSGNESSMREGDAPVSKTTQSKGISEGAPGSMHQQPAFYVGTPHTEPAVGAVFKQRRSRGTGGRGAGGGRQSRRGAGRGAMAKRNAAAMTEAPPIVIPATLNHDDREEGSSSDCMIVEDAGITVSNSTTSGGAPPSARGALSLENLLSGGAKHAAASLLSSSSNHLYNVNRAQVGGSSEVEKNGTASNSSIGSATSSIGVAIPTTATATPPTSTTPGAAVRMSTRRGAGQLLKEVLANKHHDRDSGVDEAKTDGEGGGGLLLQGGCSSSIGPTPSKRPRGRPKKQSVDLSAETNGGGSCSSMEGGHNATADSMMMSLAMMAGGEAASFLRPDGSRMLGHQPLMEGIMPLPVTPVRTPRTRGRGRGRGRGKLALVDGGSVVQSPTAGLYDAATRNFALPTRDAVSEGNDSPLFIDAAMDPSSYNALLFNHVQTPRGGSRARGGRRGSGARGPRTPRGGGRGAKAAIVAALMAAQAASAGLGNSMTDVGMLSLDASDKGTVDPVVPSSIPLVGAAMESPPAVKATPGGRGRTRAPRGSGVAGRRGVGRTPRGKKLLEAAELMARSSEMTPTVDSEAAVPDNANNTIFMTPLAGGLDLNRPRLQYRELKTPKNAIKSNTPPSSAETTPLAGPTIPAGTSDTTPCTPGGLQVFEEDTRMSGDFNFTTPVRLISSGDGCLQQNEESQSSYLSSTSVTQDASTASAVSASAAGQSQRTEGAAAADGNAPISASTEAQNDVLLAGVATTSNNSNSSSRKTKGKMEVLDAHRAAFTVDLLAEYEWPPPSPGTRGTDTFMIQEQIAEYLGVKSFKRKYPDLMRRPVDMEERNFILEQGLASEKMCDLGLTAVYASEILDIMCTDYPEKYEEYTRYTREKHFRELSNRQRQQQEAVSVVAATPVDRAQLQKEKAIESAASWNSSFNRERRDTRRACMDLQTYVVQVPKRPSSLRSDQKPAARKEEPSNYPVALVPGQFSEYYTKFTPEELACYPVNTILLDPLELEEIISSERYRKLVAAEEARLRACEDDSSSSSCGSSDDSSNDDSDSGSSSDEDDDGSSSDSCTSSTGSASSDSEDGGTSGIKKESDREKRPTAEQQVGENNDESDVKPSTTGLSVPVRRSNRASSAGTTMPATTSDVKDPTDSDDSDVPLIAHAARRKNNLLSAGSSGPGNSGIQPSIGGGKRMQEEAQSPVKRPPLNPFMCAVCLGPENKNKYSKPERFVRCNRCRRKAHPSCIGMSSVMYRRVQQYKWQCSECKICMKCNRTPAAIDSKMVYCDQCDRGYHLACKGLRNLPEGRWHCSTCTICGQCGSRTPEGHPNPHLTVQQRQHLAMIAEWTHEYGLNDLTKIREHLRTLCVPCMRQRRQRSQQPQSQATPSTTLPANASTAAGEKNALLTNNNNNNISSSSEHRKQPQLMQQQLPLVGVAGTGSVVSSMKSHSHVVVANSTTTIGSNIKQQPHTVVVQPGTAISYSPLPTGVTTNAAGSPTMGGGTVVASEVRR